MITVQWAETEPDIVAIHRFLLVTAPPTLPGPVDPLGSLQEVYRVVTGEESFALMAMRDGELVGSLGIIKPKFWWGNVFLMTNRWFFTLPHIGAGKPLLKEARSVAVASDLELHIVNENKGKVVIFNRSKLRSNQDVRRKRHHNVH